MPEAVYPRTYGLLCCHGSILSLRSSAPCQPHATAFKISCLYKSILQAYAGDAMAGRTSHAERLRELVQLVAVRVLPELAVGPTAGLKRDIANYHACKDSTCETLSNAAGCGAETWRTELSVDALIAANSSCLCAPADGSLLAIEQRCRRRCREGAALGPLIIVSNRGAAAGSHAPAGRPPRVRWPLGRQHCWA